MSKRIFITGGANGIGKALVQAFSAEGHQVAFCDSDVNKGSQLAAETNTNFICADAGN